MKKISVRLVETSASNWRKVTLGNNPDEHLIIAKLGTKKTKVCTIHSVDGKISTPPEEVLGNTIIKKGKKNI